MSLTLHQKKLIIDKYFTDGGTLTQHALQEWVYNMFHVHISPSSLAAILHGYESILQQTSHLDAYAQPQTAQFPQQQQQHQYAQPQQQQAYPQPAFPQQYASQQAPQPPSYPQQPAPYPYAQYNHPSYDMNTMYRAPTPPPPSSTPSYQPLPMPPQVQNDVSSSILSMTQQLTAPLSAAAWRAAMEEDDEDDEENNASTSTQPDHHAPEPLQQPARIDDALHEAANLLVDETTTSTSNLNVGLPSRAPLRPKASSTSSQYAVMTHKQRRELCEYHRHHPHLTQSELANWAQAHFQLQKKPCQATIFNILKNAPRYAQMNDDELTNKISRSVRFPMLEKVVLNWLYYCVAKQMHVTGKIIREQASGFATLLGLGHDIVFSKGWLHAFQTRHALIGMAKRLRKDPSTTARSNELDDGADSTDVVAPSFSQPMGTIASSVDEVITAIQSFATRDIYAMEETSLCFQLFPDRERVDTVTRRLTVAFCSNADGTDRLDPFFVSQYSPSGRPTNHEPAPEPSAHEINEYQYDANRRAWMTPIVLRHWLTTFNSRMRHLDRCVLLILADRWSRSVVHTTPLSHVTILRVANHSVQSMQVLLQPLAGDVQMAFRRRYRSKQLSRVLETKQHELPLSHAMNMATHAWKEVPIGMIHASFGRIGVVIERPIAINSREETVYEQDIVACVQLLQVAHPMTLQEILMPEAEALGGIPTDLSPQDFIDSVVEALELVPPVHRVPVPEPPTNASNDPKARKRSHETMSSASQLYAPQQSPPEKLSRKLIQTLRLDPNMTIYEEREPDVVPVLSVAMGGIVTPADVQALSRTIETLQRLRSDKHLVDELTALRQQILVNSTALLTRVRYQLPLSSPNPARARVCTFTFVPAVDPTVQRQRKKKKKRSSMMS